MRIVQRRDIVFTPLHKPVITEQDAGYRRHKNGIRRHEIEKGLAGLDDDPGAQRPTSQEHAHDSAPSDIDPLRTECGEICRFTS